MSINELYNLLKLIGEIAAFVGLLATGVVIIHRIIDGIKCLLRSDMLKIYYHNREKKQIRQYEKENFLKSYEAYKALKGNSFIDDIHHDVQEWEVIS